MATPSVRAVGRIFPSPFMKGDYQLSTIIPVDSRDGSLRQDYARGLVISVSTDTFRVLGVPLLAGRTFMPREAVPPRLLRSLVSAPEASGSDAAIVNETLARRFWPNQNAIGKELHYLGNRTVVGVVSDIHESGDRLDVQPTLYLPSTSHHQTWNVIIKVQPGTPLSPLAATLKDRLGAIIPGLPMPTADRLSDLVAEPLRNLRLGLVLLACCAALGTLVAGLGVYATSSESAAMRAQEMAVRVALGATPSHIRQLAVWRNLKTVLVAIPVGVLGSWAAARGLSHWLFQVTSLAPLSISACAAVLVVVAFASGLRPAFRASAVDAAVALRRDC